MIQIGFKYVFKKDHFFHKNIVECPLNQKREDNNEIINFNDKE